MLTDVRHVLSPYHRSISPNVVVFAAAGQGKLQVFTRDFFIPSVDRVGRQALRSLVFN